MNSTIKSSMKFRDLSAHVHEYEMHERIARDSVAPLLVKAFQPVTFMEHGFPVNYDGEKDLWKYIDSMHEGRFLTHCNELRGLTNDEYKLIESALEICSDFTGTFYKKMAPINSLTAALISYRSIKTFFESTNKDPSVIEIGPGSGLLGLLCGLSGYKYSSLEVTKSFSIYQYALWKFAGIDLQVASLGIGNVESNFLQIPWWVWCNLETKLPKRELVVANHVIREMHPLSLSFSIQRSIDLGSNYIAIDGIGWPKYLNNIIYLSDKTRIVHNNIYENNHLKTTILKFIDISQDSLTRPDPAVKWIQKGLKARLKSKILMRMYRFRVGVFLLELKKSTFVNKQELSQNMAYPEFHYARADITIKSLVHKIGADFITEDEQSIIYAKHKGQI